MHRILTDYLYFCPSHLIHSYFVYEIASQSYFSLTPVLGDKSPGSSGGSSLDGPPIQRVVWSPPRVVHEPISPTNSSKTSGATSVNSVNSVQNNKSENYDHQQARAKRLLQPLAFIYNYDIYYKPAIQGETIYRITKNGKWRTTTNRSEKIFHLK